MTTFSLHNIFIFVMERHKIHVMERRFFYKIVHSIYVLCYTMIIFVFFSNEVVVGLEVVGYLKV